MLSERHFNVLIKVAKKKKISNVHLANAFDLKVKSISNLVSDINKILKPEGSKSETPDEQVEKIQIIKNAHKNNKIYEINPSANIAFLVQNLSSVPKKA